MKNDMVLYECDPEKNAGCMKRSCMLAGPRWPLGCATTTDPECARLDNEGKPIVSKLYEEWVKKWKRGQ